VLSGASPRSSLQPEATLPTSSIRDLRKWLSAAVLGKASAAVEKYAVSNTDGQLERRSVSPDTMP